MKTGEKIRQRRLELKMTMEDLGKAIGVQRSAINKYEKGMVDIKSSTLSAIAKALGVSPVFLLDDEDNKELDILLNMLVKLSTKNRELAKKILLNLLDDEE